MASERVGWGDIKAGYDMFAACPYYALFETANVNSSKTGKLLFSYKGDDRDNQGWKILQDNLKVLEATAPNSAHILQFYDVLPKSGSIDDRTNYAGSFKFRMEHAPERSVALGAIEAPGSNNFLTYLQTELHILKEEKRDLEDQVKDLEEELEEFRNEPKEKISGVIGQVGEACNQFPALAEILKDWSTVLKHKFASPAPQQQYRPQQEHRREGHAMAGVTDTADMTYAQKLGAAQQTLLKWYAKEYGDLATEAGRLKGAEQFADDMLLLARLTADDDMMHLALKKLRKLEE